MHPLRLEPFLGPPRERDARPHPLAGPLLVVHADGAGPGAEDLAPAPPLVPDALLDRLEGLHALRELGLQLGPVVLFQADRRVHFQVARVGHAAGEGRRGVRGAVFELVAVEVAGRGGGGGGVGAAILGARGDGFAGDGLVGDVRGVGAFGGGGVEACLGEGEGLCGVVVCR